MQYLSRSEIEREYDRISFVEKELSSLVRQGKNPSRPNDVVPDYAGMLEAGWDVFFGSMREYQPKVFAALADCNPRLLVGERFGSDRLEPSRLQWSSNAFLQLGDRYLVIHPYMPSFCIKKVLDRSPYHSRFLTLPRGIAEPYYSQAQGLEVAHKLPLNVMDSRIFPAKVGVWKGVQESLGGRGERLKKVSEVLLEVGREFYCGDFELSKFKVLLDGREQDDYSLSGSVLFINEWSNKGKVFHMRIEDFETVAIVKDSVGLMDDYISWVVQGGVGSFDFFDYV